MDIEKVSEIFDSLGVTNVTYNGNSIWIENIHEDTNEVEIKDLKTGEKSLVDVSNLVEG